MTTTPPSGSVPDTGIAAPAGPTGTPAGPPSVDLGGRSPGASSRPCAWASS
ncbi:hypothetical protein NKG05_23135 [Oerskovia sp. M15]